MKSILMLAAIIAVSTLTQCSCGKEPSGARSEGVRLGFALEAIAGSEELSDAIEFLAPNGDPVYLGERQYFSIMTSNAAYPDGDGETWFLGIEFSADGQERFSEWTGAAIGRRMAVLLNEDVVSLARINGRLEGSLYLPMSSSRRYSDEEIESLRSE